MPSLQRLSERSVGAMSRRSTGRIRRRACATTPSCAATAGSAGSSRPRSIDAASPTWSSRTTATRLARLRELGTPTLFGDAANPDLLALAHLADGAGAHRGHRRCPRVTAHRRSRARAGAACLGRGAHAQRGGTRCVRGDGRRRAAGHGRARGGRPDDPLRAHPLRRQHARGGGRRPGSRGVGSGRPWSPRADPSTRGPERRRSAASRPGPFDRSAGWSHHPHVPETPTPDARIAAPALQELTAPEQAARPARR